MTTTDYIINLGLVALVILQIRGSRMTLRTIVRPVLLVAAAAIYYLRGFPIAGHDVLLYVVLGAAGLLLGAACGATTHLWRTEDGTPFVKAGVIAAILWVVGMASRMAFEEYWTHGGTHAIRSFSIAHDITSQSAWIAGLVLMALVEVIARMVTIRVRAARLPLQAIPATTGDRATIPA